MTILTAAADAPTAEWTGACLHIRGQSALAGHVPISGAKNSALALMAGSLLCSEHCRIENVPALVDVQRMEQLLTALGVPVDRQGTTLTLGTGDLASDRAPYELVNQMRASFFVIGPLLSRLGSAQVPLPGGCAIGARPVDLHVRGLQALGADVHVDRGVVQARCRQRDGRLLGTRIYLDYPSVGATETLIMAATLARGETVIENAAQEPEVADLANFCCAMGAEIYGAGTKTVTIRGVDHLHATTYSVIPDRIETGTFMVAAAITRSTLTLSPVRPDHIRAVVAKLEDIGVTIGFLDDQTIEVRGGDRHWATDLETLPFPGFPTDMQAQLMALLTLSEGSSVITETVFENRLQHVAELCRMGANIRLKGNVAVVTGVPNLSGAPVMATDLRASAALVLAGLAAQGETRLYGLHHLDRGYDRLEAKLRQVGAHIERFTP